MQPQHPDEAPASFPLDAIIVNDELVRRPARTPHFEAENKALVRLARSLTETPQHVLQELAEAALTLCHADSAGISLAEPESGVFRWRATAGEFAPLAGGTMPRDFSPCGTVLDRDCPLLMAEPARHYGYLTAIGRPISEVLLVPFYRDGVAVGTIWVVAHTDARKFDAEDKRLLSSLGEFASAAFQALSLHEDLERAGAVVREGEGHRQTILESITEGFVAVDSEWRFSYVNAPAERMYGMRREDLLGKDLWDVFPEALGTVFEREYRRAMSDRAQGRVDARFDRLDAWFEVNVFPVSDGGLSFYFRDVSERKLAEAAKGRRAEQLEKLAAISARINVARDVDSVLGIVTEEARLLIGTRQAATSMVLNPDHPQPVNVISVATNAARERSRAEIDGAKFHAAVREEQRPICLKQDELAGDPRWEKLRGVALAIPGENGWLAAPLIGRDGRSLGLLQLADKEGGEFSEDDEAILLQLSRLAAIAVENARLYEELQANDRRKDEFLAMLAHELRNPLAAIGNAVSLATRGGLQEHVEWSMDVVKRQMKHLTRLIDDLLDVSRINQGKVELRRDRLDVTPILDSAVATARPLIEERKHTFDLAIDRGHIWADVDPTRLEQMVVNLLNNAAKYSENAGHIRLSARVDGGELVISIKDEGVGIPPEKLPRMFELFAQGDRTLARSEGGLGIGLTVVKKLAEMHGGSIAARSDGLGKGSEFTIRLPAARRPEVEGEKAGQPAAASSEKARILVVDDSVDTARGMQRLLKLMGHDVALAHSGPEALEVAREHRPEFVLLDIGLPGMDGFEVASRMRQEECCLGAVIIAVSGYGQAEDRRRSKEAGFDHHLIKPLDPDILLSLLSAVRPGP
jgi:PAS domain S-box-containing protein